MNQFFQIISLTLWVAVAIFAITTLKVAFLCIRYAVKEKQLKAMLCKKRKEQQTMTRIEAEQREMEQWFAAHPCAPVYLSAKDRVKCRNCLNHRGAFLYYQLLNAFKLCGTYLSFYVVHLRYKAAHLYVKLILFIAKPAATPKCVKAACNLEANRIFHRYDFTRKPLVLKLSDYGKHLAEDNADLLLAVRTFYAASTGLI